MGKTGLELTGLYSGIRVLPYHNRRTVNWGLSARHRLLLPDELAIIHNQSYVTAQRVGMERVLVVRVGVGFRVGTVFEAEERE